MDFIDSLQALVARVSKQIEHLKTEEATNNSLSWLRAETLGIPARLAVLLVLAMGCSTLRARVHPDFTQAAVLSLQVGMTRDDATELFGRPDRAQVTTCGTDTPEPWQCLIWEYDLPGHERGRYQVIENTNRLYFTTDGFLNSWSTDLLWEDPAFTDAATACSATPGELSGAASPDAAAACLLVALPRGDWEAAARFVSPPVAGSQEQNAARLKALTCELLLPSSACTASVVSSVAPPLDVAFRFAAIGGSSGTIRYHVLNSFNGGVRPLFVTRAESGRWFVAA